MEGFGYRLQYSVFICDLSTGELSQLEARVLETIRLDQDSVVRIDLGPLGTAAEVRFVGRTRTLPTAGPHVL